MEIGVKKLQEAGMTKQDVVKRSGHKANDRRPFLAFFSIGDSHGHVCVAALDQTPASKADDMSNRLVEIDSQNHGHIFGKNRVIRPRVHHSVPEGGPLRSGHPNRQ